MSDNKEKKRMIELYDLIILNNENDITSEKYMDENRMLKIEIHKTLKQSLQLKKEIKTLEYRLFKLKTALKEILNEDWLLKYNAFI